MIIDVGAGADTSATAFMAASNKNIVVVVPEPTSFGLTENFYPGAAEIANTFDNMCSFAHLTNKIPNELFDVFFNATLNDEEVYDFLKDNNLDALKSMKNNFIKIFESGLWISKRNSIIEKIYYEQ